LAGYRRRLSVITVTTLLKGELNPVERALLITLGGAIGTLLRYVISLIAARWLGTDFPYGTLIVNLSGAFIIGVVQHLGTEPILVIPDNTRLFLTTGMMGGLTTYSTFSYETVRLMESGLWTEAWINITVTTVICLILCFLGMSVGRTIVSPRG
jgi:CrcB protein